MVFPIFRCVYVYSKSFFHSFPQRVSLQTTLCAWTKWRPFVYATARPLRWHPDVVLITFYLFIFNRYEELHQKLRVRSAQHLSHSPHCLLPLLRWWTFSRYHLLYHYSTLSFFFFMLTDMRNYIKSSEFEVLNTSAIHHIVFYPCCGDEPFPDITYYITIRRKAAFHIYVLILPSILLSFLTLVLFWIPPQRPDRTSLGKHIATGIIKV